MSNYMDNNKNNEYKIDQDNGNATINVYHNDHMHKLDITNIPINELEDNSNQCLGDAHRASEHYPIDDKDDEDEEEKSL